MPAASPERANARREEIIAACERLYETRGFREITLKMVGEATSFSRANIYNYFHSKEEIFLAILEREYRLWIDELEQTLGAGPAVDADGFAQALARSVANRPLLLKIIAMNHYDMETNSRLVNVVEFKRAYGDSLRAVAQCLQRHFPKMAVSERQGFLYAFFPFMYGIHPYTEVSDKQRAAMAEAGVDYVFLSSYELTYDCIKRLLAAD